MKAIVPLYLFLIILLYIKNLFPSAMTIEEKAKQKIESIKARLQKEKIAVTDISQKDYNFEFSAEQSKSKVKVQVYFGKKGVKVIFQGDDKSDLFKKVRNLSLDEPVLDLADQPFNEPEEYIGTDECGKGDFFGPLVAAAVYVNDKTKVLLRQAGVRDSKDLSDFQIKICAKDVKRIVGVNYSAIRINPEKYNQIYEQFGNLNKLLNWAHSKAVSNLLDNIKCKFIITDKFCNKELDISSLEKHSDVEFLQETKAEKYVGVAAASILARESFLEWFDNNLINGKQFPKGSSEQTEHFAKLLLKKINEDEMKKYSKLHFKTYKKIKS
jgi:ribonuclease HIII